MLLGFAGTGLSGCNGNAAGLFPADWNLPNLPDALAHAPNSSSPALSDLAPIPVEPSIPSIASGMIGGLQRQADCSLTYLDFSYAPSLAAVSVTPNSEIPHYEKTLHNNGLLTGVPGRFLTGCVDSNQGITSRPLLFLGMGKNGRELVAVSGKSGVVTSGLKSDGTFTPPATQATPLPSISLVSGDLNEDGNADVVSINSDSAHSSVTVFLGKDDGTYQAGVTYPLPGANGQYAVLDDLNGDGILDLLVSSESPAFTFSIFIGNGDGTFQPPRSFTPANAGIHYNDAFVTADVNGDGAKDIVTAQGRVLLGDRDAATYTPIAQAAFPPILTATNRFAPSIVAADFNHDGKVDLATDDGLTIRTFRGDGDGTFTAGPAYPTIANYGFLTATDLDGDGNIDLWTGYGGNGVYGGDAFLPNLAYALMGNGDGTFQGVPGLPEDSSTTSGIRRHKNSSTNLVLTAPSPSAISVVSGQTSSAITFNVSSPSGTPQTVTFACSGLPEPATCFFNPGQVSLTADLTSSPVSITIQTAASAGVAPERRLLLPSDWTNSQRLTVIVLLALSIVPFRARVRKIGWMASACLFLALAMSLGGCTNGKQNGGAPNSAAPGIYVLTVSANSAGNVINAPGTVTVTVTAP